MFRAADTTLKTDTGRQRRENEDNAYMRAPLFVVADGMGGAQAGEVASALAVEAFQRPLDLDGPTERRLANRVQEANRKIYETSRSAQEHAGMGTTLTATYLDDFDLAVAHVGDSRAYIFRNGTLTRLTQDHSLVEELVRRGKLTEEQAAEHPQRSIITRALGIENDVQVDTWTYPVRDGDVVLMCSDGLTSMIGEADITAVLASEPALGPAADKLIAAANDAGGRDNITVVLFRVEAVDGGGETQATQVSDAVVANEPAGDQSSDGDGPSAAGRSSPGSSATMTVAPSRAPSKAHATAKASQPAAATTSSSTLRTVPGRRTPSAEPRRRGESRLFKATAALIAIIVVLFLFGGGGYLATRELFFIGTNNDGVVTVYRGLPYDGPFGLRLYEQVYVSGVPVTAVPAARRKTLLDHHLRSQNNAIALVRAAELGQLTAG